MTNYRIIEDRAYEMAEEGLSTKEIVRHLIEIYGIGGEDAWEIAEMAMEDFEIDSEADLDDGDWDREMGFDPYEGCWTGDC